MKPQVLWIEDSARLELRNLTGPVYFSGKYDFNLAEDVTTAVQFLKVKRFDVIIVDVRLPPGVDSYWRELYHQAGLDKVQAQLGIRFLRWLLTAERALYPVLPVDGITPQNVGVFTVESYQDLQGELDLLGVKIFQQKSAGLSDTVLVDLIEKILAQKPGGKKVH